MITTVILTECPYAPSVDARPAPPARTTTLPRPLQQPANTRRAVPAGRALTLLVDARLTARAPPLVTHIAVTSATFLTALELIRDAAFWELGVLSRSVPPAAAGGTLGSFIDVIALVVNVAEAVPSTHCDWFVIPLVIHLSSPDGERGVALPAMREAGPPVGTIPRGPCRVAGAPPST